jgi:hypothetical protein
MYPTYNAHHFFLDFITLLIVCDGGEQNAQELEGPRRRGRPKKRWKEKVETDLHVLGVRRWRELATNRKKMAGYRSTG